MTKRVKVILIIFVFLVLFLIQGAVADQPYSFVKKWGSQGSGEGQFLGPQGVAVDTSGNVYVVDIGNNRIQKFDPNSNFVLQWGSEGSGDNQFYEPYGIAIGPSGNVYVADTGNARIMEYMSNGAFVKQISSEGAYDGYLEAPMGVAVDSAANIYVTDFNTNKVQKFDSDGNFVKTWGSPGSGEGQFLNPTGIAVDFSDDIYVADTDNHRIQKFDSNGKYLMECGPGGNPDLVFNLLKGVDIDKSGNIYVVDSVDNLVQKYDSGGNLLTQWGSEGSSDGQFKEPFDIAVDFLGFVYVADANNYRIQKFAPPTTLTITSTPPGEEIFVDYKDIGHVTPYTITDIVPGSYVVQVNTPGSLDPPPLMYNVAVKAGEANSINFNLDKRLYIVSNPPGSEIILDGKNLGVVTPYLITDISAGEHTVEIIPPGSTIPSIPYNIEITEGKFTIIKIDLTGKPTPEFPSLFLPATMIIGFLGAVLLIKRTREN